MNLIEITNYKKAIQDNKIKKLISYAMFNPTEESIYKLFNEVYFNNDVKFFVLDSEYEIAGLVGIRRINEEVAEILHIAVDKNQRNQGIGREIIQLLLSSEGFNEVIAETDNDAMGFYEKCGFQITSLGEKYQGTERFICKLIVKRNRTTNRNSGDKKNE